MKSRIIVFASIVFWSFVLVVMLQIWPLGRFARETESKSKAALYSDSGFIKDDLVYKQIFKPQYPYLRGISVQINRDSTFQKGDEGRVIFSLYDDKGTLIAEDSSLTKLVTNKNYYEFKLNNDVNPNKLYSFVIRGKDCESNGPSVRYGETEDIGLKENKTALYNGKVIHNASTVCIYHYNYPMTAVDVVTFDALILFFASLLYLWGISRCDILK